MELSQITIKKLSNNLYLDDITYGIIGLIPLDINSMIFSGGLLFDAYWKKNFYPKMPWNNTQVKDIDLFLFGSDEIKKANILSVINILTEKFGEDKVCVGLKGAVITILIVGIPRIVQITCTNKLTADEVIYDFDLAHVMLYWSNKGLYVSPFALISMYMREILPNPKSQKTAKMSRLFKYQARGLGIDRYISEYTFIFEDDYKVESCETLENKYSETNNLEKIGEKFYKHFTGTNGKNKKVARMVALFEYLGLTNKQENEINNLQAFDINQVNLSGDFEYLGGPEPFLRRDIRVLKSPNCLYDKDCEYTKLYKYNIPEQFSKRYRHKCLIEGEIIEYFYNKSYDNNGDMKKTWGYRGPHVVVLAIDNDQTITTVKSYMRAVIESLEEQKPWATTCLFDSQAIKPEEKELYCVNNPNRAEFFKDLMNNFVNSKNLYMGVSGRVNYNWSRRNTTESELTNPKYWTTGSRIQIIGDFEAITIDDFIQSKKMTHCPYVYFETTYMIKK